jgi:predicted class III extradiol MEMO1 family dioxygenase
LHGKDWEGAGTTQDQTDGDEDRRTRAFNFCIPHGEYALCGSVQAVAYLSHLNESTLPQIIELLEEIEFVDIPTAGHAESSSVTGGP